MKAKRILTILLIVLMALTVLACKKSEGPVDITVATGYPELESWFKIVADELKKTNPNITVNLVSFPLRDFEKKVSTALPSGTCYEVITMRSSDMVRFIEGGMILKAPEDLATFMKGNTYPAVVKNNALYKGDVYGVTFMVANVALFYNTKMFAEAGLKVPPKTMDEIADYARKLAKYDPKTKKLERAGISLRLSGGGTGICEKFWIFLIQNGGSMLKEVSPGKYKADYDNDAGLKTLQLYVDAVHKFKTDDPILKHDAEAFEMGAAAMFVRESWVIGDIKKKAADLPYDTAPMPKANLLGEKNFFVTNSAKGPKEKAAWEFIRTALLKPEIHKQVVEQTGWVTGRNDINFDALYQKVPQFKAFMTSYDTYDVYRLLPEYDEIMAKFSDRLANKGFTDPSFVDKPEKMKAFLKECAAETHEILKRNGHLAE